MRQTYEARVKKSIHKSGSSRDRAHLGGTNKTRGDAGVSPSLLVWHRVTAPRPVFYIGMPLPLFSLFSPVQLTR
jgi:hypothetical protein